MKSNNIRYHTTLAEYFAGKPLYLDEPEKKKPNTRKLVEQPWQQTEGYLKDDLITTLTNLDFIEAKCRSYLRYELVSDYSYAESVDPEKKETLRRERERCIQINRYIDELIKHSSDPKNTSFPKRGVPSCCALILRGLLRLIKHSSDPKNYPLPEPPRSVTFDTNNRPQEKKREWTFDEILNAWGHFVANHISRIGGNAPLFQMAYNSVNSGPVPEQVEDFLQLDQHNKAPWIRLLNRPAFNPHPVLLKELVGKAMRINSVAISADGSKAFVTDEYLLDRWNVVTGELETTLHGDYFHSITPDMRWAISSIRIDSDYRQFGIWDLTTRECIRLPKWHADSWEYSLLTPDGRHAVSCVREVVSGIERGHTLRLWDCRTGKCLSVLGRIVHRGYLKQFTISNDARYFIAGPDDTGKLYVWNLQEDKLLYTIVIGSSARFAISSDSNSIVTTNVHMASYADHRTAPWVTKAELQIWDLPSGNQIITHDITHEVGNRGIYSLAITADGKYAVTTGSGLIVWSLQDGTCLKKIQKVGEDPCAITPDCRIAVTGKGNLVRVWDLQSSIPTTESSQPTNIDLLQISRKRCQALSGHSGLHGYTGGEPVCIWDIATQELKNQFTMQNIHRDGRVSALLLLPDEDYCLVARNQSLQLWNISSQNQVSRLDAHESVVYERDYWGNGGFGKYYLRVTADGSRAFWSNTRSENNRQNGVLLGWDLRSGQSFEVTDRIDSGSYAIVLTSDGRLAITTGVGLDCNIKVWDLESMECINILERAKNQKHFGEVEISPDNCFCGYMGEVWNVNRNSQVRYAGGGNPHFLPNGRLILGSGALWNIRGGGPLQIRDPKANIVPISPDGQMLAWHRDAAVGLYDLKNRKDLIWHENPSKPSKTMAICWPYFLVSEGGNLNVYKFENVVQGPAIVTPTRLWLFGQYGQSGRWDNAITTVCEWCGKRFRTPDQIVDTIRQIALSANLSHDAVPSLDLPEEAWDEPKLVSECPFCHKLLKFNPFVVDNRDRLGDRGDQPLKNVRPCEKAIPVPDLPVWQGSAYISPI